MFRFTNKLFVSLILIVISSNLYALRLKDVYKSKIPVPDKTEVEQKKALVIAFKQILVRTALDNKILALPEVIKQVAQVDKYISKYYYSQQNEQIYLNVEFDPITTQELFKTNNKAYLTDLRPRIAFWLVLEENGITNIIEEHSDVITNLITSKAAEIGLPIVFPMYDFIDQEYIGVTEIVEFNFSQAVLAAKRYKADYIVFGKIKKFADEYSSAWHLIDGTVPELNLENKSVEDQIDVVLRQLAMYTLQHYAKNHDAKQDVPQATSTVTISVSGIDDLEKLANIETYLNELPYVDKLQVGELHDSTVTFNLSLFSSNRENLINALNLNSNLILENQLSDLDTVVPGNTEQLHYRYR
jgi:hypothetical protein